MLEKLPDIVGQSLGDVRAGLTNTLFHAVDLRQGMAALKLASLAFADHAPMPRQYTADGPGLSPPLHWSAVPVQATEVLLIVEDADLAEAALSAVGDTEPLVTMGRNSLLQSVWLPPDPPPGHGVHRYVFQLFALGPGVPLPDTPGRDAVRNAVQQRGLASGCLIGTYERSSTEVLEESATPGPLVSA